LSAYYPPNAAGFVLIRISVNRLSSALREANVDPAAQTEVQTMRKKLRVCAGVIQHYRAALQNATGQLQEFKTEQDKAPWTSNEPQQAGLAFSAISAIATEAVKPLEAQPYQHQGTQTEWKFSPTSQQALAHPPLSSPPGADGGPHAQYAGAESYQW
jgi:hypothetical protein